MSTTVDNRVVKMEFDNSTFLKHIKSSIESLGNLSTTLNKLDGQTVNFDGMNNSLGTIADAVDNLKNRFSTWGIVGMQVVEKISGAIIDTLGSAISKVNNELDSLTVDQVTVGWSKYAEKSEAVATIMASTSKSVEEVSEQMERLNWFTDETSYNFTDMASNIGKFTANQIDLEDAVTEMEGIATWAALSGQNATAASRAMYNMSQAVGVGAVKLMDWKSIENANMATAEFKQAAIDAAVEVGTLTKVMDDLYQTSEGTEVTIKNFSTTLSEGWFDTETIEKVLGAYGNFAQGVNDVYNELEEYGVLTKDIVKSGGLLDKYAAKTDDLNEYLADLGVSEKDLNKVSAALKPTLDQLISAENTIGRKAFKAAQECRTFSAAIDATKDAASTAWMNIYESLFGNVEEATELWSNFCEFLYDALIEPVNKISGMVDDLIDLGGWEALRGILSSIGDIILTITDRSWSAFADSGFVEGFANSLKSANESVADFAENFIRNFEEFADLGGLDDLLQSIHNIGVAIKSIISPITRAFAAVFGIDKEGTETAETFKSLTEAIRNFTANLGLSTSEGDAVYDIFVKLFTIVKDLAEVFGGFLAAVGPDIWNALTKVTDFALELVEGLTGLVIKEDETGEKTNLLVDIFEGVGEAFDRVKKLFDDFRLSAVWDETVTVLSKIWELIEKIFGQLTTAEGNLDLSKIIFGGLGAGLEVSLIKLLQNIAGAVSEFKTFNIGDIVDKVKELVATIVKLFAGKKGTIIQAFKDIAVSVLLLAAAMLILSAIDTGPLIKSLGGLAAILIAFLGVFKAMTKFDAKTVLKLVGMSGAFLIAAAAILVMAVALAALAGALELFILVIKDDPLTALTGLAAMAGTLAVVVTVLKSLSECAGSALVAAAALLVVSVAIIAFAAAMAIFVAIASQGAVALDGFILMAGTIVVLAGAMALLGLLGGKVLIGAAALLIGAAALAVFAAAITVAAVAFAILVAACSDVEAANMALSSLVGVISIATIALIMLGAAGPEVLVAAGALLVAAAACVVFSVAIGILNLVLPKLAEGIEALVASIGKGIADGINAIGDSVDRVSDAVEGFGDSVRSLEGISWLETAVGVEAMAVALKKLNKVKFNGKEFLDSIKDLVKEVPKAGDEMMNNYVTAIEKGSVKATTAVKTMCSTSVTKIRETRQSWYNAGLYVVLGFANGITDKTFYAEARAAAMAKKALKAAEKTLEEKSPSREFAKVGAYAALGFAKGIEDNTKVSTASSANMANAALAIADKISSEIDEATVTITPVLDMSDVEKNLSNLNANAAVGLTGTIQRSYSNLQNASYIPNETQTVKFDTQQLAQLIASGSKGGTQDIKINFTGSLSQLARILQPEIVAETSRRGPSLVNR